MPRQTLEWRVPFDLATRHETCENGYGQEQCKTYHERGGRGRRGVSNLGRLMARRRRLQASPGQPTCLPFIMNAAWQRQQLETRAKQDVHSTAHTRTHTEQHMCMCVGTPLCWQALLSHSPPFLSLSHFICLSPPSHLQLIDQISHVIQAGEVTAGSGCGVGGMTLSTIKAN